MTGPVQAIDGFIDIEIPKPPSRVGLIITIGFVSLILVAGVATLATVYPIDPPVALLTATAVVLLCLSAIVLYVVRQSKRLREERRRKVAEGPEACARFLADKLSKEGDVSFVRRVLKDLVRSQNSNVSIRIHWTDEGRPIQSLEIPFSPLTLDESEPGFIQMEQATTVEGNESTAKDGAQLTVDEKATTRKIARNLRLKGGWIMLGILGFNAAISIWQSFERRSVTLGALLWACFLLIYILVSPTSGPFSRKQWLIMPGGLVLRRPSRKDSSRSQLHVFDRRASVLCVFSTRGKTWCVCVADTALDGWTYTTTKEMTMLLRAWLSPLEPPPVEKLIDLT